LILAVKTIKMQNKIVK